MKRTSPAYGLGRLLTAPGLAAVTAVMIAGTAEADIRERLRTGRIQFKAVESCTQSELGKAPRTNSNTVSDFVTINGDSIVRNGNTPFVCDGRTKRDSGRTKDSIRNFGKLMSSQLTNVRADSRISCSFGGNKLTIRQKEEWRGDVGPEQRGLQYDSVLATSSIVLVFEDRGGRCAMSGNSSAVINAMRGRSKIATAGSSQCRVVQATCSFR